MGGKIPHVQDQVDARIRTHARRGKWGQPAVTNSARPVGTAALAITGGGAANTGLTNDQVRAIVQPDSHRGGASAAGSDAYAITLSPTITALTVGMEVWVKADVANTGAATLNVNGIGAAAIKKQHDQDLASNDIEAGQVFSVRWDGTNWQMVSQLASTAAGSGDVAGDIHAAVEKATPADNDELALLDSADSYSLKKILWSTFITVLTGILDLLYAAIDHTHAQLHDRVHDIDSTDDHTFPGGTTNFLREDGTFAEPPGGTGTDLQTRPNLLINGGFEFHQRQAPGTATARTDDSYGPDRWIVLASAAGWTNERGANIGTNSRYSGKLVNGSGGNARAGYLQIIESSFCRPYLDGTHGLTFTCKVLASAAINVRAALVTWSGFPDAVTSDLVNDWTSPTFTKGNFFISSADLVILATGNVALDGVNDSTLTLSGTPGGGNNNLVVMVWTEDVLPNGGTFQVGEADLYYGGSARHFEERPTGEELALCQRYYEKSWEIDTAAGASTGVGMRGFGLVPATSNNLFFNTSFSTTKRAAPTVTLYDGQGHANKIYISGSGLGHNQTGSVADAVVTGFRVVTDATTANKTGMLFHFIAESEL